MKVSPRAVLRDADVPDLRLETEGLLYGDGQCLHTVRREYATAVAIALLQVVLLCLQTDRLVLVLIELSEVTDRGRIGRGEEEIKGLHPSRSVERSEGEEHNPKDRISG